MDEARLAARHIHFENPMGTHLMDIQEPLLMPKWCPILLTDANIAGVTLDSIKLPNVPETDLPVLDNNPP